MLQWPHRPSRSSLVAVVAAVSVAWLPAAGAPAAAATPEAVASAVSRAAAWIPSVQREDGNLPGFGGDWSLTALAAAGVDAAVVRRSPTSPSAQDYFLGVWTGGPASGDDWTSPSGPRTEGSSELRRPATDYERALLIAHAAGLQPTRLAPNQNLVAQLAGIYRGRPATPDAPDAGRTEGSFGSPALFNGTVFGLLALARTAVPQALLEVVAESIRSNQHDDGGWTYQRIRNANDRRAISDIDMTGAAIAALCESGATADDEDVREGVAFLASQLTAEGGFASAYSENNNADSAAWAVSGLNACAIDPQAAPFVSGDGRTPIDFLLSLQRTTGANAGSFRYRAGEPDDAVPNLYATQDALRALAGEAFSAQPRSQRPAPLAPAGAVVPQALAIDAGVDASGQRDVRFCRVHVPVGASVGALLTIAASAAQPAGCVSDLAIADDGTVRQLNGVAAEDGATGWVVRRDGGPSERAGRQPVCLGQIVSLAVAVMPAGAVDATPCTVGPPTEHPSPGTGGGPGTGAAPGAVTAPGSAIAAGPASAPTSAAPAVVRARALVAQRIRADRRGRVALRIRCPRSGRPHACRTTVLITARVRPTARSEAHLQRVATATSTIHAGQTRTVRASLSGALRRDLARAGVRGLRIEVRTAARGGAPASVAVTRTSLRLRLR